MKNVIIYCRVSTDEQAEKGASLKSQQDRLEKYCEAKQLNIVLIIKEDYSAWHGFDRPAYNELKTYINKNKKNVDAILFTQWSRFSRESTYAHNEVKALMDMGIEPNAIEQYIDYSIPDNKLILSTYLAIAQLESDRNSERTKTTMRFILKTGRWLWQAPYGYSNNSDSKLVEINNDEAAKVRSCFESVATGLYTAEEIRRKYQKEGLPHSKQGFLDMLQNVFYTGKIKVPEYKKEPAEIINGLHPAIISADVFETVQFVLSGKKKSYKGITKNTETPLVGHLYCSKCNKPMTGSGSKGNGGVYHYYHCQRKYGCSNSYNAIKANQLFVKYIGEYQAKEEMLELYKCILHEVFKTNADDRENTKINLEKEIAALNEQLKTATMKNINGVLRDDLYMLVSEEMENKKSQMQMELNTLNMIEPEFNTYVSNSAYLMGNLNILYKEVEPNVKRKIIGSIFPEKIYFENNMYRTTKINEAIGLIHNAGEEFKKKQLGENTKLSSVAPPAGLEPATL